jgi:hypothetical protein
MEYGGASYAAIVGSGTPIPGFSEKIPAREGFWVSLHDPDGIDQYPAYYNRFELALPKSPY